MARTRWQRLDAEHWVYVYGIVATVGLTLWTVWTALVGLAYGFVVAALIPGALAFLAGWMTSAWRQERPWSWWAWTVLATLTFLSALAALVDPRPVDVVWLVGSAVLLLLLVHPVSRARIERSDRPEVRR